MALTAEQQAQLQQARIDHARSKEMDALFNEVQAAAWARIIRENSHVPNAATNQQQYADQAERGRGEADALRALAGVDRTHFRATIVDSLRNQRRNYEMQLLAALDAKEHPEAYGEHPSTGTPEQWQALIDVADEFIAEVEGWK